MQLGSDRVDWKQRLSLFRGEMAAVISRALKLPGKIRYHYVSVFYRWNKQKIYLYILKR